MGTVGLVVLIGVCGVTGVRAQPPGFGTVVQAFSSLVVHSYETEEQWPEPGRGLGSL